jgi:hypothetical protein
LLPKRPTPKHIFGDHPAMTNFDQEPMHVTVSGTADDPRTPTGARPGVVVHRAPPLHPDDVTVVDGIPVTSVSRTLVDLAEVCTREELREAFRIARKRGLLDMGAVEASYERVEWRPSLAMLREVMDELTD